MGIFREYDILLLYYDDEKNGVFGKKMMKTTIRKRTYQAIYRLLDRVSPLSADCGLLCGAVCCCPPEQDDQELGIYLLPGEEKLFTRKEPWLIWNVEDAEDFDFPASWRGKIYFVRCTCAPKCPRKMRPLQCRFFPAAPHLTEDGRLLLIRSDLELPYSCPLITDKTELEHSFLKATHTVWRHLIRDPLLLDLVRYDSEFRCVSEADILYPR